MLAMTRLLSMDGKWLLNLLDIEFFIVEVVFHGQVGQDYFHNIDTTCTANFN